MTFGTKWNEYLPKQIKLKKIFRKNCKIKLFSQIKNRFNYINNEPIFMLFFLRLLCPIEPIEMPPKARQRQKMAKSIWMSCNNQFALLRFLIFRQIYCDAKSISLLYFTNFMLCYCYYCCCCGYSCCCWSINSFGVPFFIHVHTVAFVDTNHAS